VVSVVYDVFNNNFEAKYVAGLKCMLLLSDRGALYLVVSWWAQRDFRVLIRIKRFKTPLSELLSSRGFKTEHKHIWCPITSLLTPCSRVLLEKLTGFAANQQIPRILWNTESSLPYSQAPATCPYPEPSCYQGGLDAVAARLA
jgi:hypothetical protein